MALYLTVIAVWQELGRLAEVDNRIGKIASNGQRRSQIKARKWIVRFRLHRFFQVFLRLG